jgi:C-terminal of Roc, COR, domain
LKDCKGLLLDLSQKLIKEKKPPIADTQLYCQTLSQITEDTALLDFCGRMLDSVGAINYLSWSEHDDQPRNKADADQSKRPGKQKQLLVVLDPKWLTVLLTSIVTSRHNLASSGILSKKRLYALWKNEVHFEESLFPGFVRLLEKLDVLLDLNDKEFLVPCLLPDREAETLMGLQQEQGQRQEKSPIGSPERTPGSPIHSPPPEVSKT